MLVDRESRILQTLSRDLLRLEKSHVTRHGGECGGETSEVNINYFCNETLGSMNQLTDALCDFHHKLAKLVGWQNNFSKEIIVRKWELNLEKKKGDVPMIMILLTRKCIPRNPFSRRPVYFPTNVTKNTIQL